MEIPFTSVIQMSRFLTSRCHAAGDSLDDRREFVVVL